MYAWPTSTGYRSAKFTLDTVSSRDQPLATASATAQSHSSSTARCVGRDLLVVTGPWPGTTWSTSSAWTTSREATHWLMSEVMSHVWHSAKTVSPVKTTRSSGT